MVPRAGFEPATYRLGGDCSIQLSYRGSGQQGRPATPVGRRPDSWHEAERMVEPRGVEPLTSRVRF